MKILIAITLLLAFCACKISKEKETQFNAWIPDNRQKGCDQQKQWVELPTVSEKDTKGPPPKAMKDNIIVKRFHTVDDKAPTDPEDPNTPFMNLVLDRQKWWVKDEMKKRKQDKEKGKSVDESEEGMRDRVAEAVLHSLGEGPQNQFGLLALATASKNRVAAIRKWLAMVQGKKKQDLMKMFNKVCTYVPRIRSPLGQPCVEPDQAEAFVTKCTQPIPKDPEAEKKKAEGKEDPMAGIGGLLGSMGMGDLMSGLGGNAETANLLKTSMSRSSSSTSSSSSSMTSSSSSSFSSSSSSSSSMSSRVG